MRISDWSSDVCSSDLVPDFLREGRQLAHLPAFLGSAGLAEAPISGGNARWTIGPAPAAVKSVFPLRSARRSRVAFLPLQEVIRRVRARSESYPQSCAHLFLRQGLVLLRHFCRDRKSTRLNSSH